MPVDRLGRPCNYTAAAVRGQILPLPMISAKDVNAREPVTRIDFPKSMKLPGGTKELSLYGVGVREKSFAIIKVRVYAMGIYMESQISNHLTPWKGKLATEVLKDDSLSNALIQAPVEKGVSLVLVRDVGVEQFLRGFKETIIPCLRFYDKNCSVDKVLAEFSKPFQDCKSLKTNTTIYFTWIQSSTIQIAVTNEVPTDLTSPPFYSVESLPLAQALFGMFLGANPITPIVKFNAITSILQVI